jgi:hypothetical protein
MDLHQRRELGTAKRSASNALGEQWSFAAVVNQQLHFHAGNGGTQLSVHSPNVDARLDIRMLTRSSDPAANPIAASRSQVVLPAGQVVRLEPSSWQREALSSTPVRRAVIPAFGSSQVLDITTI